MAIASSICSEAGRLDLFAEKSNRPASERILLETPMSSRMLCVFVVQNKSTWWIKNKQPIADSVTACLKAQKWFLAVAVVKNHAFFLNFFLTGHIYPIR